MQGTAEQVRVATRGYRMQLVMVRISDNPWSEEKLGVWSSVEVPAATDGTMPAPFARVYNDAINRLSAELINVRQALL